MVAQQPPPDDVPNPFAGLDDRQVLARAEAALRAVHAAPITSIERSIQWAVYEQCAAELNVRAWRYALRKIHERGKDPGDVTDLPPELALFRERHPEVHILSPERSGGTQWRASWLTPVEQGGADEIKHPDEEGFLAALKARFDPRGLDGG